MNAGGRGAGRCGALRRSQRRSRKFGRFGAPATEFRSASSLSLGKLGFEVQWNGYGNLSITVLMETDKLWKADVDDSLFFHAAGLGSFP
jgi:hypothetical protein